MAGHSHYKNIKRKKEVKDAEKAAVFSKMARLLVACVREKGKDAESNAELRALMEKAKQAGMPKENIERAIKRGAGEGEEGKLESFLVEAYAPEGVAFLIQGMTDNKNRDLQEIKEVLKKQGGKLADPGSVKWMFDPVEGGKWKAKSAFSPQGDKHKQVSSRLQEIQTVEEVYTNTKTTIDL